MNFKEMVIYQIYPRSFYDSNGDGLGDLAGVTAKLDYLKNLGVDMIWLTPFFQSPQKDNGYDVSDYYSIDPLFGSMDDLEELIAKSKSMGIELMLDMVFNHTSTEHAWFQEAVRNNDRNKQDFYIFNDGSTVPTNWQSKFGGSAWHYIPEIDKHYLHLFDKTQADLNWKNSKVRDELVKVIDFWLGKGVMGLRFDVINLIAKSEFIDDTVGDGRKFYTDQPDVHRYLKELYSRSFGKNRDIVTVGELSSASISSAIAYTQPQSNELTMAFNFHHLKVDYKNGDKWSLMPYDFLALKDILFTWQLAMQKDNGWQALFWSNHDQPRVLSRFGSKNPAFYITSAKMLANALYLMRGTPFIFQGEEIGLVNASFESINDYRDVESYNYYNILKEEGKSTDEILAILAAKSRDHGRTPIPWSGSETYGGFSDVKPWINLIKEYDSINVEANLSDKNSIFYHYKELISFRKKHKALSDGSVIPHYEDHPSLLIYQRQYNEEEMLVVANFYEAPITLNLKNIAKGIFVSSQVFLHNYNDFTFLEEGIIELRAYESFLLKA